MATMVPSKGHRHSKSAAFPPAVSSELSQHPQNPHHLNSQAHATNSESETIYSNQPTTPPRTPRKEARASSHKKPNATTHETASKQKPRSKRPKNVMTSSAAVRNDRNSPPLTGAQYAGMPSSTRPISTPSTAAYAGSTFHASPAPSALPIPSFYSKSVPESPSIKAIRSLDGPSIPESPSRIPAHISSSHVQREASPLDIFFIADREEKARARSASSTQATVPVTGPFQPPTELRQPGQTSPAPQSQNRPRHSKRMSSSGMFAMELDGASSAGPPYGPAFSTPYSERINAARSTGLREYSTQTPQQTVTSEALKAYLFSGHDSSSSATSTSGVDSSASFLSPAPTPPQRNTPSQARGAPSTRSPAWSQNSQSSNHDSFAANTAPRPSGRSSGLRQEVTPTRTPNKASERGVNYTNSPTPSRMFANSNDLIGTFIPSSSSPIPASYGASSGNKNADIKGMEDSLRRILKLDSNTGVSDAEIGSGIPTTTASEPTYVGGKPPPRNGIHNGVMGYDRRI